MPRVDGGGKRGINEDRSALEKREPSFQMFRRVSSSVYTLLWNVVLTLLSNFLFFFAWYRRASVVARASLRAVERRILPFGSVLGELVTLFPTHSLL